MKAYQVKLTAQEFIDEGYAEKIQRKLCVVRGTYTVTNWDNYALKLKGVNHGPVSTEVTEEIVKIERHGTHFFAGDCGEIYYAHYASGAQTMVEATTVFELEAIPAVPAGTWNRTDEERTVAAKYIQLYAKRFNISPDSKVGAAKTEDHMFDIYIDGTVEDTVYPTGAQTWTDHLIELGKPAIETASDLLKQINNIVKAYEERVRADLAKEIAAKATDFMAAVESATEPAEALLAKAEDILDLQMLYAALESYADSEDNDADGDSSIALWQEMYKSAGIAYDASGLIIDTIHETIFINESEDEE